MDELSKIEEVTQNIRDYIQIQYDLVVLKGCQKASEMLSEMVSGFLIVCFILLSLMLLSFGAAYYISSVRGDTYSGLFIVGGAYFVIGLIAVLFRKSLLTNLFRNKIIQKMFEKTNNNHVTF